MASDVVIRAEGLGKKYIIGHQAQREGYVALRDVIARNVRNLGRTAMDVMRGRPTIAGDELEEFWALKGLDFEIRRGDVVGVIGRNGAGKSTLLKVLSRITEPTEGRVEIRGRVASLLEVGTGFHPELTGRENIYLNGAILGMSHAEIRRKFDEIVDFAEVEKFLDTPVKRYSSGMYVRLAFAVAAHLEPEILIVDEVLAVGDAEFQKKCLGKMGEVAGHGRTVLFVSHNMAAVQALCGRGIVMSDGRKIADAPTAEAITAYLAKSQAGREARGPVRIQPGLELTAIRIAEEHVTSGGELDLRFDFGATQAGTIYDCTMIIYTLRGERVGVVDPRETQPAPYAFGPGAFELKARIKSLPLVAGDYSVALNIQADGVWTEFGDLANFTVSPRPGSDFKPIAPEWRGIVELESSAGFRSRPCVS